MKRTRILSILISVCMIISCMVGMSVSASAADPVTKAQLSTLVTNANSLADDMNGIKDTTGNYASFATKLETLEQVIEGAEAVLTALAEESGTTELENENLDAYNTLDEAYGNALTELNAAKNRTAVGEGETISVGNLTEGIVLLKGATITDDENAEYRRVTLDGNDNPVDLPYTTTGACIVNSVNGDGHHLVSITLTDPNGGNDEPEEDPDDNDEDDDKGPKRPWAEKPTYVPSGTSGTKEPAGEDKPAEEPKDNDKQEEPKDNDKQEEPKDNDKQEEPKDNDKDDVEIPNDRDTGNDGTTGIVDGSTNTNENPHTGVALGGLSVLVLAGAAIVASKKRK